MGVQHPLSNFSRCLGTSGTCSNESPGQDLFIRYAVKNVWPEKVPVGRRARRLSWMMVIKNRGRFFLATHTVAFFITYLIGEMSEEGKIWRSQLTSWRSSTFLCLLLSKAWEGRMAMRRISQRRVSNKVWRFLGRILDYIKQLGPKSEHLELQMNFLKVINLSLCATAEGHKQMDGITTHLTASCKQ